MIDVDRVQLEMRALEALGDAVVIVSLGGRVAGWTGAAEAMLGYKAEEIVGQPLGRLDIYSDEARAAVFQKAATRGRVERGIMLRHRDGHQIPVLVTLTPLANAEGQVVGVVGLIKDIGPWMRKASGSAASALESVALAALQDVALKMTSSLNVDDTLGAIAEAITTVLTADAGLVMMHDEAAHVFRCRKVFGNRLPEFAELEIPDDRGLAAAAVATGEIQRTEDYAAQPPTVRVEATTVSKEPVRSAVFVPLTVGGRRAGAMVAYRRVVEPFNDQQVSVLSTFAYHASAALDNALAYQELAETRHRLEVLLDSTAAIWRVMPFEQMCAALVEQGRRMLPGSECLISIVPPERSDSFRIVAGAGPWAETQVGLEVPFSGTVAGSAIQTLTPVETTRFARNNPLRKNLEAGGIETARLVPLSTGAADSTRRPAMGVMGFYRQKRRSFNADERRLIDEFGRRASLALHRAELLARANGNAQRMQRVVEVANELAQSLEPRKVVRRLVEQAVHAVGADRGALVRVVGEDTVVEDAFDVAGLPDMVGYRHPIRSQPLMQRAVSEQVPVLGGAFEGAVLPEPLRQGLKGVRHTATLPLVLDRQVFAVLVLSRRADTPFSTDDVAVLRLIGNQAVLALRNARLFAQVQEASRVKSDFLNLAAHELRTPLSVITGYLSMLQEGTFGTAPEEWRQPVEMLSGKTRELTQLVDDLLLAARLEAGTVPSATATLDLRDVVRDAMERAEARAMLLDAEMLGQLPPKPVLVRADPDHLGRILDNLINNALTYSNEKPWLKLSVSDSPCPRVSVEDHGRGIPPEMRERIFERFVRIDDPDLRRSGTGLGLSISRDLAHQQGAELMLERSEVGRGSVFVLEFGAGEAAAS